MLSACLCRVVQWRHQVLRRKGYLKFYRKMRNVRRIPFIIVSLINSVILLFVSLLYIFNVTECTSVKGLHSVDFLYIIVGMELLLTLPCLIFYVGMLLIFSIYSNTEVCVSVFVRKGKGDGRERERGGTEREREGEV